MTPQRVGMQDAAQAAEWIAGGQAHATLTVGSQLKKELLMVSFYKKRNHSREHCLRSTAQ